MYGIAPRPLLRFIRRTDSVTADRAIGRAFPSAGHSTYLHLMPTWIISCSAERNTLVDHLVRNWLDK